MKLKTGDKVFVNDGSWSYEVKAGKLVHSSGIELGSAVRKAWEVLVSDQTLYKFPTYAFTGGIKSDSVNDTILTDKQGKLVFIQQKFLSLMICPVCGKS